MAGNTACKATALVVVETAQWAGVGATRAPAGGEGRLRNAAAEATPAMTKECLVCRCRSECSGMFVCVCACMPCRPAVLPGIRRASSRSRGPPDGDGAVSRDSRAGTDPERLYECI